MNLSNQQNLNGFSDLLIILLSSAHDMKNSLSVMTAYLESAVHTLAEKDPGTEESKLTRQALYEAQRMNYHLFQVLAMYKLNKGLYPFDPQEIDLHAFTEEAIARIRCLADAKKIEVAVNSPACPAYWYFDYELISSLITQSLFNAIRYTNNQIRLSIEIFGDALRFCIEDNGPGYPEAMLDETKNYQAGINNQTGSTGLGLHFASLVAKMHRNKGQEGLLCIDNQSSLGGSRFVLTLP